MTVTTFQAMAMIIYFIAMLAIGWWAYGRNDDFDDYMLAGRGLGPVVTALSAGASDMSGWLLMGLPGALYITGIVEGWIAVGLTVGAWLNWRYVAPRLRTYTEVAGNSITVPSFLDNRLHDASHLLRWASGLIILVFFTFYVSSGMVSGGYFFESSFGMDYRLGLALVAGITVIYTLVGGFLAVSYTDLVQGLMMVAALLAVPIVGVIHLGGVGATLEAVAAVDPDYWAVVGPSTSLLGIISALAWGLGYFGQPHIIVRFMAMRSPQEAKAGRRVGIGWMLFACAGAAGTAVVGVAVYQRDGGALANPETVFISLGQMLFHPFVAGFMLAAILAAIMSTVASQLLVTSSALIEDLYLQVTKREVSQRRLVMYSRFSVLLVAVVAAAMAWSPNDTILALVAFAWAGFGASFGPTVLLALYWKRLTPAGALAGMVTGAAVVMLWGNLDGGVFDLYEILPGFVANIAVAVGLSLVGAPDPAVEAEFDEAVAVANGTASLEY
ncbi:MULTISPECIES: sodium/proline symporter PutP [Actinomyces]|uniref:Sodium/proline symporter n=1 Tax=Actinomyces respiraculi TaxID=2744574 RepID=A0A7T0LIL5_9ACTO|nr:MULTISPECIES: sodium/proline symporter PutP [Actinomyces]QPL04426.1 sodium/proline symporter PutP [Actinomyces respiraculi]